MILKDRRIVLGVTGAISAYKALEITRLLVKEEAAVFPVMTANAGKVHNCLEPFHPPGERPIQTSLTAKRT